MNPYEKNLSERKRQILKAIVDAHIAMGEPVGSKFLAQTQSLSCSSATIRNEMAELEEMGYLEQPHTSSGRVPSELGYRFYVDSLLQRYAMTAREIAEINNLLRIKMTELDRILDEASKLASNLTHYTGIAIKPPMHMASVTRFEVIFLESTQIVLVMITSSGAVKSKTMRLSYPIDADTAAGLATALNTCLANLSADQITLTHIMQLEQMMGDDAQLINPIFKAIYDTINEIDDGELRFSGLNHLLRYPELYESDNIAELIDTLEKKNDILSMVSDVEDDDINVMIGSENTVKVLNNSAVVFKPIKHRGRTVGYIGVIGPRRMNYAKVLATIEGLSGNISNLITETNLLKGEKERGGEENTGNGKP